MKVVYGSDDVAGRNISYFLEKNFSVDVTELGDHPVYHDYPEREVNAAKGELIIIPSQHKSMKNVRSLTVHAAGNFDTNDLGGEKNKMAPYDARYARGVLLNITKYAKGLDYQVTYEATKQKNASVVKSATFLHIKRSEIAPDYYAEEVTEENWKWFIFPWNRRELMEEFK